MTQNTNDPCAACNGNCCVNLSWLKLSKKEFKQKFSYDCKEFVFKEHNGIYIASVSRKGECCPYLDDEKKRCTEHETRPIECRLFPYTIGSIKRIGHFVIITYHHRTFCSKYPLMSRKELNEYLKSFAKDAFGPGVYPVILPEIFPLRQLILLKHMINKIRA